MSELRSKSESGSYVDSRADHPFAGPGEPKPRVALVMPDPRDPGGITRAVDVWMQSGLTERAEITIVPMSAWDAPRLMQLLQAIRGYARLARLLTCRRVDVVHVHVSVGGSLFRKAGITALCRLWRVPVIVHLHSGAFAGWVSSRAGARRVARWTFSHSSIVIVLASIWVELARELGALDVVVVPHVLTAQLDADLSEVASTRVRKRDGRKPPVFLYYGRWSKSKGIDILADALRQLGDDAPVSTLRVFGNGDRDWLEQCFQDIGSVSVHLGAWLSDEDKLQELEEATVLVHPSRVEAFGQTLLETMRAGVPIITTDAGAISEVVAGYPLVRFVPPNDSAALASALRDVLDGHWPPAPTTASFERTSRAETVSQLAALYERLTKARRGNAA